MQLGFFIERKMLVGQIPKPCTNDRNKGTSSQTKQVKSNSITMQG